jgi:hypothetical protein
MEQRKTQYIPVINNEGEVVVNGNVLKYVEKDRKKFLYQIGITESTFKVAAHQKSSSKEEYKKTLNKMICEELGISLPYLQRWTYGLWWKVNVAPVKEYSKLFRTRRYDIIKLRTVKKNKPLLDAAVADNQTHLLPIINATGKSAEELRKEFGKGVWKKLCGNTFHRNNVLVNAAVRHGDRELSNQITRNIDIPTTLVQAGYFSRHLPDESVIQFLINSGKGYWGNRKELITLYNTARDTILQCDRLGTTFNPKWSIRRLKEEHDKNTQIELAKKYTKDTFPIFADKNYPSQFEHEGLVAHLLKSPYDMQMEGQKQKHCVAGYSRSVANGDYLVYSVRDKEGNTLSTIGYCANTKEHPWRIQQHCAACNQQPSDECKIVSCELMKKLNS